MHRPTDGKRYIGAHLDIEPTVHWQRWAQKILNVIQVKTYMVCNDNLPGSSSKCSVYLSSYALPCGPGKP